MLGRWRRLAVPVIERVGGLEVEERLEASNVVVDYSEVLILHGRAHLQHTRAAVQELQARFGRIDATGRQNGKTGHIGRDLRDGSQRDRTDRVARHAAVCGQLLLANSRPSCTIWSKTHEAADRVCGRAAVGAALLGRLGDLEYVGDVGCELGEERDAHGFANPRANVAHKLGALTARQAHAALAHAVRAAQVELERVRARRLGHLGQLGPVVAVVAAHDARYEHAVGKVALELANALTPVGGVLLRDELYFESNEKFHC